MDSLDPSKFFYQVKSVDPWKQVAFGSNFIETMSTGRLKVLSLLETAHPMQWF